MAELPYGPSLQTHDATIVRDRGTRILTQTRHVPRGDTRTRTAAANRERPAMPDDHRVSAQRGLRLATACPYGAATSSHRSSQGPWRAFVRPRGVTQTLWQQCARVAPACSLPVQDVCGPRACGFYRLGITMEISRVIGPQRGTAALYVLVSPDMRSDVLPAGVDARTNAPTGAWWAARCGEDLLRMPAHAARSCRTPQGAWH